MGFLRHGCRRTISAVNGGIVLTYQVKERPLITDVRAEGMKAIRPTDDKVVAAIKLHPGAIVDPGQVEETINGITKLYQDKGYLDATATFRTIPQPNNTAVGVFDVTEGPKVEITADRVRRQQGIFGEHAARGDGDCHAQHVAELADGTGRARPRRSCRTTSII